MYYDFRGGRQFCAADTNGCAAGPSLTEAKLAAVLELIERDAVAIWWYNRLCLPAVDLASLGDAKILSAAEAFRRERRMLYVLDITTDLQVPAYVAIAPRFDGSEPCFGAAAACSHREAVFKAIAEASQVCFWASVKSGSEELLSWLRDTSVNEHGYLRGHGVSVARGERALTAAEGLRRCVDRLQAAGIEAHYLELTRAELGLPVVRAIAPGLRHFWARLAPGRLYDVPVRMGRFTKALTEAEMNPVACMI
jgi:thiazole/oxazole-forming peptide maturase SagD family component